MIRTTIVILLFNFCLCENINQLFQRINEDVIRLNAISADIAWNRGAEYSRTEAEYQLQNIIWYRNTCGKLGKLHNNHLLNKTQERIAYLLCRGPKFTFSEAREFTNAYNQMLQIYKDAKVCLPHTISDSVEEATLDFISSVENFIPLKDEQISVKLAANLDHGICLVGSDFEKMMKSKNEHVLKLVWLAWRENCQHMMPPFAKLVVIENEAARNNRYNNIGEVWRDEVEVPYLRKVARELYKAVRPLYQLLHGVVRHHLRKEYGDVVPEKGLIPVHLLGSLWPHNWESVAHLIMPKAVDLNNRIKHLNWTVKYMMERAEDFFVSLGLPALPDAFWAHSVLTGNTTDCSGAAADMYRNDDVRMSYCSGTEFQDFRVLHHELGHVQYFMAYKHQPGIFRKANTILHESIGDAVMYGVMTPQHLNRLRIISDAELYNNDHDNNDKRNKNVETNEKTHMEESKDDDENKINFITNLVPDTSHDQYKDNKYEEIDDVSVRILLKQLLFKLPQIPYSLLIDEYRWRYFEGGIDKDKLNTEFWTLAKELMGLAPPNERSEHHFDIAAELHVADNTPFIRYFLSSFIQHQIFESLCKASVFGRNDKRYKLPTSIPLHRCDIYGSKVAGNILKNLMSRGDSQHWQEILSSTIGEDKISTASLQRYYRPLVTVLQRLVKKHKIPLGW